MFKNNQLEETSSMLDLRCNEETMAMNSGINTSNGNQLVTANTSKNKELIKLETFNLTSDKNDGFKLEFDDANWSKNINLLKPLVNLCKKISENLLYLNIFQFLKGLSILLNTCNKQTVDYYLKFSDLLKIEAEKSGRIHLTLHEPCELKSIGDRR